jgi:hypothetical protein
MAGHVRYLGLALAAALVASASCSKQPTPPASELLATRAPQASSPIVAADLPPIPPGYDQQIRSAAYIKDAFLFAAQHPEVLDYMPCYCGCDRALGHRSNTACFVSARDSRGKVTQWVPHGVICEVCQDVAHTAMQMHNSGATTAAIRAEIDRIHAGSPSTMVVPMPPKGGHPDPQ